MNAELLLLEPTDVIICMFNKPGSNNIGIFTTIVLADQVCTVPFDLDPGQVPIWTTPGPDPKFAPLIVTKEPSGPPNGESELIVVAEKASVVAPAVFDGTDVPVAWIASTS